MWTNIKKINSVASIQWTDLNSDLRYVSLTLLVPKSRDMPIIVFTFLIFLRILIENTAILMSYIGGFPMHLT